MQIKWRHVGEVKQALGRIVEIPPGEGLEGVSDYVPVVVVGRSIRDELSTSLAARGYVPVRQLANGSWVWLHIEDTARPDWGNP